MDGRTRSTAVTAQAYGPEDHQSSLIVPRRAVGFRVATRRNHTGDRHLLALAFCVVNRLANAKCRLLHPAMRERLAPVLVRHSAVHLGMTGAGDFRDFSPLLSAKQNRVQPQTRSHYSRNGVENHGK